MKKPDNTRNNNMTPCIGVCSTGIGDDVCRGCKRFAYEVVGWNGFVEAQRESIWMRISELLSQVVKARVEIVDQYALEAALLTYKIKYNPLIDPHCWVHELLRAGASQIISLQDFGCRCLSAYQGLSMVDLKQEIDEEFFNLSVAHYARYIRLNQ